MKFNIEKKEHIFYLSIDGEEILSDHRLGIIMNKIEAYLKMRYLKEEEPKGFLSKLMK